MKWAWPTRNPGVQNSDVPCICEPQQRFGASLSDANRSSIVGELLGRSIEATLELQAEMVTDPRT